MEQYISKSALVAEIKRRIKELQDLFKEDEKKLDSFQKTAIHLCIDECKAVLNILDTLEVKEEQKEPVSEELEKVAQEHATKEGYLAGLHYNSMVRAFKAGAKWYASRNDAKLPDNLLLAARKASIAMCDYDEKYLDEYPYDSIAEQKFIEGAKWQKEQLKAKGGAKDEVKEVGLIIHTIIAECCDWLAMNTNLSHDKIEECRNLMLTVKEEQFKIQKGE